jgi:hypothetical protein
MQDSIEVVENTIIQSGDTTMIATNVQEIPVQQNYELQTILGEMYLFFVGFVLIFAVYSIICHWKIYVKANRPGWESIVPFYNVYVFFKIIGVSLWNILWVLLPFAGPIILAVKVIGPLAKSFGKGTGFAFGLFFLSPIFQGILAFDSSVKYVGPNGVGDANPNSEVLDGDI